MHDIVKRLRDANEDDAYAHPWTFKVTCDEAADEIERLRGALEAVVACHGSNPSDAMADMDEVEYIKYTLWTARKIARAALEESK